MGLVMAGLATADGMALPAANPLRHPGSRLLTGGMLGVEVMDPHHAERYNRGVRFSPLAAVLRVWSEEGEFLFSPTGHDPLTEHGGLPTEFDVVTSPPGFAEAREGEPFVKIGVGALRKRGDQYRFFESYELVTAGQTEVEWGKDRAVFSQVLDPVNGYGYRLEAAVVVTGNTVLIDWALENTGTARLVTECYTHNYIRMGEAPIGPDDVLEFPYDLNPDDARHGALIEGPQVRLTEVPSHAINLRIPYPDGYEGPNRCVLRHEPDGRAVEMLTTLPGRYTAVFATAQTFCPEQFIKLDVPPGERVAWVREYRFH